MRALWILGVVGLLACAGNDNDDFTSETPEDANATRDSGGEDASSDSLPPVEDAAPTLDGAPPPVDSAPLLPPADAAPPPLDGAPPPPPLDAGPPPPPVRDCQYPADDFGAPPREYDVMGQSAERLSFSIQGVPAEVQTATLAFTGYDLDHPGQEGRIWINGNGPLQIPARAELDNQSSAESVDVTGLVVPGLNVVEFGSSTVEARTFFRISEVALNVSVAVERCVEPPPPPPPEAREVTIGYRDARYTQRHNWCIRCNDYAFTAHGDEHRATDCDGGYQPDGSRAGKAIFEFPNMALATYEVSIRSRHTENRNPQGALFVVNGVERRISQRSDRGHTEDTWGQVRAEGTITVELDSTREDQSDSIIWVRLRPVGG